MAEARPDRSALSGRAHPGDLRANTSSDLTLAERWPLAILQIERIRGATTDRSFVERMGGTLLEVGPDRWLLVDRRDRLDDLTASLAQAAKSGFAVIDLSHARTVLRIAGGKTRDVLNKGCALDLHSRVFPAGSSAATSIAEVASVLVAVDDRPAYDVYVPRSYGQYVWEWLSEAAAEYGYRCPSG